MEIFTKEIQLDHVIIELSVQETVGCRVTLIVKDKMNNTIWKTLLTDSSGNSKVYPTVSEAFSEAEKKINIYYSTYKRGLIRI